MPKTFGLTAMPSAPDVEFCCSGCRTVASVEDAQQAEGDAAHGLLRLGLAIFFTMNVMVFTMALWSHDVYPVHSFENPLALSLRSVFRWASMVCALPVLWLLGGPIFQGVSQALRRGDITTDLLIVSGVSAAYCYSLVSVLRGTGHVYFEVGAMVLVFISIGRWLEAKGKRRTGEALDALANLLPATVHKAVEGRFLDTPREDVKTGDVLRILPGERIPLDGVITLGGASIDEQMVTGESQLSDKTCGDVVFSGTTNLDGDLRMEVTAADGQETLSRLVELVRAARSTKGCQEQLADRVAVWFVPTVCLVGLVAGVRQGSLHGVDQGLLTALAVVLIACPCALGLATPMAVWTALGRAASFGVLFRSGLVMERLGRIRVACFDKTGTLTSGTPSVAAVLVSDPCQTGRMWDLALSMADGSAHPLSRAIRECASRQLGAPPRSESPPVETIAGKGLVSTFPMEGRVWMGNRRLMDESRLCWSSQLMQQLAAHDAAEQVFIGWNGQVRGAFCLVEEVRPEAGEALAACRQLGLELQLLTGDRASRAAFMAQHFNLPAASDQLPEDKVSAIRTAASNGGVAMIGDGLNDAPALASADVGIALGCGADVSRDAAGVCLLSNDLRRFPWAVGLARLTSRIVRQNLFWSFTYNCIGMALAATGRLNPIWAALAMAVSSLLVVSNSLRLSHYPAPGSTSAANSRQRSLGHALSDLPDSASAVASPQGELVSTPL